MNSKKHIVKDLMNLCVDNNEINLEDKFRFKIKMTRKNTFRAQFNQTKITIGSSTIYSAKKPKLKLIIYKHNYFDESLYDVIHNVNQIYDVNLFNYADDMRLDYGELIFIFNVLHEIGHLNDYIYEYNCGTILDSFEATHKEKADLNYDYKMGIIDYRDASYKYRLLDVEKKADMYALNIITKYRNNIEKIIKRYF